jgi:hypothetical protein
MSTRERYLLVAIFGLCLLLAVLEVLYYYVRFH